MLAPHGSASERRQHERHLCGADHPLTVYLGLEAFPAQVRDISQGGIGLFLRRPLPATINLQVKLATSGSCFVRQLEVLRVIELSSHCCIMGGRFDTQLRPDELAAVLS